MSAIELCIIDRSSKDETIWYRVRFVAIDSATGELVRESFLGYLLAGGLSDARKHVPDDMGRVANKMLSEHPSGEFELVEVWARITG